MFAGLVRLTVGGELGPATVIVMGAEVTVVPPLSVARAVRT